MRFGAEIQRRRPRVDGVRNGDTNGHEPEKHEVQQEQEEAKEDSPLEPLEEAVPANTLTLHF